MYEVTVIISLPGGASAEVFSSLSTKIYFTFLISRRATPARWTQSYFTIRRARARVDLLARARRFFNFARHYEPRPRDLTVIWNAPGVLKIHARTRAGAKLLFRSLRVHFFPSSSSLPPTSSSSSSSSARSCICTGCEWVVVKMVPGKLLFPWITAKSWKMYNALFFCKTNGAPAKIKLMKTAANCFSRMF